jgi:hypothetical protein
MTSSGLNLSDAQTSSHRSRKKRTSRSDSSRTKETLSMRNKFHHRNQDEAEGKNSSARYQTAPDRVIMLLSQKLRRVLVTHSKRKLKIVLLGVICRRLEVWPSTWSREVTSDLLRSNKALSFLRYLGLK